MNNNLILSKCKNCKRKIPSLYHTKRCPYCLSFDLEHYFSQSIDNPDTKEFSDSQLEDLIARFERIFKYYSIN